MVGFGSRQVAKKSDLVVAASPEVLLLLNPITPAPPAAISTKFLVEISSRLAFCKSLGICIYISPGGGEERSGRHGFPPGPLAPQPYTLISHKVFLKSSCRSQPPHKSINLSFIITNINNLLTGL